MRSCNMRRLWQGQKALKSSLLYNFNFKHSKSTGAEPGRSMQPVLQIFVS